MARYRVYAKCVGYYYADVEADSKEEALEIAEDMDGSEFTADVTANIMNEEPWVLYDCQEG